MCLGAASALVCAAFLSCATATGGFGSNAVKGKIAVETAQAGLEAGRYSGLAASLDGVLFLAEQSGWRAQAFRPGEGRLFEIALPSARCLVAGGFLHGFCAVDLVDRRFIRYDQHGSEAYGAAISGHGASAFCLAPSGETLFLDPDAGTVVVRDQGFRESRRWQLKGRGRPQAIAADLLEGLVVASYPDEKRLDTYSVLGLLLGSSPAELSPSPQSLAFDGKGRLWAAGADGAVRCFRFSARRWEESGSVQLDGVKALAAGPAGSVLALADEAVIRLGLE